MSFYCLFWSQKARQDMHWVISAKSPLRGRSKLESDQTFRSEFLLRSIKSRTINQSLEESHVVIHTNPEETCVQKLSIHLIYKKRWRETLKTVQVKQKLSVLSMVKLLFIMSLNNIPTINNLFFKNANWNTFHHLTVKLPALKRHKVRRTSIFYTSLRTIRYKINEPLC